GAAARAAAGVRGHRRRLRKDPGHRPHTQRAQAGGTSGVGLFVYERRVTMGGSELYLGSDLQGKFTGIRRSGLETLTGKRTTEDDILGMLNQFLRDPAYYSPDNALAGWGPLTVGHRRRISMWLAGTRIINEHLDALSVNATKQVFVEAFRRRYAEGTPDNALRKLVGSYSLKLFNDLSTGSADALLPPEYRGFGSLHPATPLTDDFSDSVMTGWSHPGTVGFTDTGSVASNDGSAAASRYDTDLSGDDHYCKGLASIIVNQSGGVSVRFASGAWTAYSGLKNQSTTYYIYEHQSGTPTQHASGTGGSADNIIGLEVGNTGANDIELFEDYDGAKTSRVTYTDTATLLTGNTRCGIHAWDGGGANRTRIDDWEADIFAAGATPFTQAILIG
ncbi:MAG: hypothetical protein IIB16_01430, partial [Chloroflexi bacterium]|nr:hypothetical protein [Chloroflexota bacterium]